MTRPPPAFSDVERRLLRLIWGGAAAEDPRDAGEGWPALDTLAARHRLRPLLHDRTRSVAGVPAEVRRAWAAAHVRAAVRAMRQRATAVRIGRLIAPEEAPALLLKGGALVWRGWIDPALRPMRDLDLVVADGAAPRLHARLVAAGFAVVPGPASLKHLPTLRDPVTGCHVEIHRRLLDGRSPADRAREAVLRDALFGSVEPFLPGLAVTGTTETLFHLVLHAAADHQFNNGPLLLLDMALLVDRGGIDWPRFWRLAEACRAGRPCRLALRLAERHAGVAGIEWDTRAAAVPPDPVVDAAAALMLVSTDEADAIGWIGRSLARRGRSIPGRAARVSADRGEVVPRNWPVSARDTARNLTLALMRRSGRRHVRRMLLVARWIGGD